MSLPRPLWILLAVLLAACLPAQELEPPPEESGGVTGAALRKLQSWGAANPELVAKLREKLDHTLGRGEAGGTEQVRSRMEDWLKQHSGELSGLEGLTEAETEDDLLAVLAARRGLLKRVSEPVVEAAAEIDEEGGVLAGLWKSLKGAVGGLFSRFGSGSSNEVRPDAPGLEISEGSGN